jgi:transposase
MKEFAECMKWLVDEGYPQATVIRVVLDNLSTHKPAALYETFPPAEARRILKRLEFHFTPKHGSWLNMAEIELSVFSRTMKTYIPEEQTFRLEAQALENERNGSNAKVDWQFRSADARIKLKQLYPSISS